MVERTRIKAGLSLRAQHLIADFRGLPRATPGLGARDTLGVADAVRMALREIDDRGPLGELADKWSMLVGPAAGARSHPDRLDEKGRLVVAAATSAVSADLAFRKRALLTAIRRLPAYAHVTEIVIRMG